MKEAAYYLKKKDNSVKCILCPNNCFIKEGNTGICGVRKNSGGRLYALTYEMISSLALDPIEKKPLDYFMPGTYILSVGTFGCNFKCSFCQNYGISQERPEVEKISADSLCIKGYVSDDSNAVVNGAMIELAGSENHETFTDSNGYYVIECRIGEYNLKIESDGFEDFLESNLNNAKGTNWYNISLTPIVEIMGVDLTGNTELRLEQGGEMTLSFLVTNIGETKEDFGFKIEGWDTEIGILNLKSTQITIKPGETKMISATVFLTENAPSGKYQFTLKTYLESDDTTNDELEITLDVTNDGNSDSGFNTYYIVGLVGILVAVVVGLLLFFEGKNNNDVW